MRLIGNKTKLLPAIEAFLAERGVTEGTFLDVFAGTATVGRHFRKLGFRVRTNDLLCSSYVRQQAYIQLDRYPAFAKVRALKAFKRFLAGKTAGRMLAEPSPLPQEARRLREVVAFLNACTPQRSGLFARQYAEGGSEGRLFFSEENGRRIDGIHARLLRWRREGLIDAGEFALLLTSLLEAADRVANISGTYGAFLKALQASARERLTLRPPALDTEGPAGRAYNEDANKLVRRLPVDVLYLDPPYNHRQYAKNYHVLEVLAELHTVDDLGAYEGEIYGKTGLRAFGDRLSSYCRGSARRGPSPCEEAFRDLVVRARAEHIVVSYSEEGILSREAIGEALAAAAGQSSYAFARDHQEIAYKRFRSDGDGQGRQYRVLHGRARDEVAEWLFYVRKPAKRRTARARAAG